MYDSRGGGAEDSASRCWCASRQSTKYRSGPIIIHLATHDRSRDAILMLQRHFAAILGKSRLMPTGFLASKPQIRIIEAQSLSAETFVSDVVSKAQPAILRGLIRDWPSTRAGDSGHLGVIGYLKQHSSDESVTTSIAPPSAAGRLFYDNTGSAMNFLRRQLSLASALDLISSSIAETNPDTIAVQSVPTHKVLPGFSEANRLAILPDYVRARVWIGNQVTIAAHYDSAENVACVVFGRRRFTLFSPEQVGNLYPGPFELTPAGPIVSMVDFDQPDHTRYPRFRIALESAITVDLEAGDAIYIPYLWWHHVRSLDPFNMLVNYWWNPESPATGEPLDAMLHAMLAIKTLPHTHREAWAAMFAHYVFERDGTPGLHLPVARRGIQAPLSGDALDRARSMIARRLSVR